jgi:hypothetical protein
VRTPTNGSPRAKESDDVSERIAAKRRRYAIEGAAMGLVLGLISDIELLVVAITLYLSSSALPRLCRAEAPSGPR